MLEVSRVHQNLKETFQTLTALVPTDSVLQRFPQNQLRRILKDETLSKGIGGFFFFLSKRIYIIINIIFFLITPCCSVRFKAPTAHAGLPERGDRRALRQKSGGKTLREVQLRRNELGDGSRKPRQ